MEAYMSNLGKALREGVEQFGDDKVILPRKLWDEVMEAFEEYGLLKAMEEAEGTPLLSREEALQYLGELDKGESQL
jgi:hypothetical protein